MKSLSKKIFILLFLAIFIAGCSDKEKEEIKIGFVAGLSGKYSNLGTSIRDGFTLAFDEINNNIEGHKVIIIQKDDKQDLNEAKKIIDNFIKNDTKIIVGNATSSMTSISFNEVNKQKDMLLFSATASGGEFTKKDDNFIRLQVEHSAKRYTALKEYVVKNKFKKVFFIYDSKNYKYAKGYENFFQNMLVENGGSGFIGRADLNKPYEEIKIELNKTNYDLILIVGNSLDSASLIQYIRLNNINKKILCSGWAKTLDFIANGGKSVEGVVFATGYDDNSVDKSFVEFVNKFEKRYNKKPSVFSAQGYELAKILIQNLKNSTNTATLKNRILEIKQYSGLQGDIVFDKYGDVFRKYFMMEVKNREYIKIN